ncbi:MAG TPA: imelysin family protein [Polyangiaceae bacterium]|nr:imelysin family protein [Polyangiaceae bacterium]
MKHHGHTSRNVRRSLVGALITLSALAGTVGCSESDSEDESGLPENTSEAISTYSDVVHASYQDSLETAMLMDAAIQEFLDDPSDETLDAAKQSWLDAREPYLQTEVYRFYDGPIDNPDDGPEGLINAWPLDERYIDYTVDDPASGIINDPEVEISAESLMELNEQGGEKNIATGYHAIEFLLWGEDRSEDGPGDRPYTDYVEDGDAPNADRRGLYLRTVSALLVEHLESLVAAWAEDEENYRAEFESIAPKQAFGRILTGMINLSGFETGGERLNAALATGSQEDEHSCFSDNTHRDMIQDIQGVLNVWEGRYVRVDDTEIDGVSVHSIVRAMDPDQAEAIDTRIRASLELAKELHVPFDREIAPGNEAGNERVSDLVDSLDTVDRELQAFFETLGLESTRLE